MERAGKVVGQGAAVVFLRHGDQAGEPDEQQQEELERESRSEHSEQESAAGPSWPRLRKGGIGATFYGPEKKSDRNNSNIFNDGWTLLLVPSPSWKLRTMPNPTQPGDQLPAFLGVPRPSPTTNGRVAWQLYC